MSNLNQIQEHLILKYRPGNDISFNNIHLICVPVVGLCNLLKHTFLKSIQTGEAILSEADFS